MLLRRWYCEDCQHEFRAFVESLDAPSPPCPRCNQDLHVRAVPPRVYGRYGPGTYTSRKRARNTNKDDHNEQ